MKQIRSSKFSKFLAYYLAIMMFLQVTQPLQMYALTSGPTQPEFNAFTPIGTSDMVDLASGDFNYNIPIMDVGGYPINLAYNSGVTMDQEASWVGLGWNLNVGQIERQVRGLPDDFRGDEMIYENDLRDNVTIGTHFGLNGAFAGYDGIKLGVGLGVQWNNYEGITFKPSYGVGFALSENVSVGLDFTSSTGEGATVKPSVSISKKLEGGVNMDCTYEGLKSGGTLGLGLNSRQGVSNLNLSLFTMPFSHGLDTEGIYDESKRDINGGKNSGGGSLSFNNQSFTPSKRIGFENGNFSFSGAFGVAFYLTEGQAQVTGYGSYQKIAPAYKNRKEKAFGYENTEYKNSQSGVLDFNRENERTVSENTTALALTNYTYDIYNISGQGVSGMFRPYRSQVSYLYNDKVVDNGFGTTLGVELGGGGLFHAGSSFTVNPSSSHTGGWFQGNNVLPYFEEKSTDLNELSYEPVTFKMVGGLVVDPQEELYTDFVHENKALRIGLDGPVKNRVTKPIYYENYGANPHNINTKIKRTKRFLRNQVVQKITAKEAEGDAFVERNDYAEDHHTAGIKVLQTDGTTYVYGNTAYNTTKIEATFDVSARTGDNTSGLVTYNGSTSGNNLNNSDKFLNKITTPDYAHSYQISAVLSSDYEDIDGNGPSLNDLGSYTQFTYTKTHPTNPYKWRVPFDKDKAMFNNGLFSKRHDQKANYIYGEKELVYLDKIITKTHVAFFDLEERKDAIGASGEHGGPGIGRLKKIKSIRLYSRPEITVNGEIVDPLIGGLNITPIKMAHFVYSYDLCGGSKLTNKISGPITSNEIDNDGGKLTLKKVYFTYRGSNIGKYTPYTFEYKETYLKKDTNGNNIILPLDYDNKGFDIWGNFKPNTPGSGNINTALSTTEFPFVEQDKFSADQYTAAWTLNAVNLPSGGKITIQTESDDYQFVQDRKAMQMFKVIGAGNTNIPEATPTLYSGNDHKKYIYVKLSDGILLDKNNQPYERSTFINDYLKENLDKDISFRFLLNMTDNASQYDYVNGYFRIQESSKNSLGQTISTPINVVSNSSIGTVVALPLKFLKRDGGSNGSAPVNPIAKTGWGFGRTYLNREVYSLGGSSTNTNFTSIVQDLVGSIAAISELIKGPNKALQDKGCARIFKPNKSWVRLENPNGKKLGGGLRVKSVKLSDQWDTMLSASGGTNLQAMEYGQEYSYEENGKSTGVATYEPNASSENPLIEPFFPKNGTYAEKIAAPRENNYVETPFGENFFPSPKVTYSKVSVKNSYPDNPGKTIKKHASGRVVTTFYTSKDFPTIVHYTEVDPKNDIAPPGVLGALAQLANIRIRSHLAMSQGFSIETNDMNGKTRTQEVYTEGEEKPISKVEYLYNTDENNNLDNSMTVINSKGEVSKSLIGLDYDMVNDFNESISENTVAGFDGNLGAFLAAIFPVFVPTILPKFSYHENKLRTAVTTKHIHKTGILVEKIATDLGSTVSTKNLAWDAESGQVLLTETINEYDDHYYSFNYPAYWMYSGMGLASNNIGIEGKLVKSTPTNTSNINSGEASNNPYFKIIGENDLSKYFHLGDELSVGELSILPNNETSNPSQNILVNKLWVVGFNNNKSGILLMDRQGNYVNKCNNIDYIPFKIVRSGYRNLQAASMASVTSMINPIRDINGDGKLDFDVNAFAYNNTSTFNPRIINASAVVYNDYWKLNGESNLPNYPEYDIASTENYILPDGNVKYPYMVANPYVLNIKGDWRAIESYAYLTGRNHGNTQINNPRNEGFYKDFSTFYKLDTTTKIWSVDKNKWTYASSVTKYSPYGVELENKDALNRHSAAQYGYNYTLPMAVASNSKYDQMGFEGFEETPNSFEEKHFSFNYNSLNEDVLNSHTGKKSIRVNNNSKVTLNKFYKKSNQSIPVVACPVDNIILCPIGQNENVPIGSKCFADTNEQIGICFEGKIVLNGFDLNTITIQNLDGTSSTPGYSYNYVNSLDLIIKYHSTSVDPYPVNILFTSNNGTCCSITLSYRHEATGTFGHFSGPIPCTN